VIFRRFFCLFLIFIGHDSCEHATLRKRRAAGEASIFTHRFSFIFKFGLLDRILGKLTILVEGAEPFPPIF